MDMPADPPLWFASFLNKTSLKLDQRLTAFRKDVVNHLTLARSSTGTSIDILLKEHIEVLKKSLIEEIKRDFLQHVQSASQVATDAALSGKDVTGTVIQDRPLPEQDSQLASAAAGRPLEKRASRTSSSSTSALLSASDVSASDALSPPSGPDDGRIKELTEITGGHHTTGRKDDNLPAVVAVSKDGDVAYRSKDAGPEDSHVSHRPDEAQFREDKDEPENDKNGGDEGENEGEHKGGKESRGEGRRVAVRPQKTLLPSRKRPGNNAKPEKASKIPKTGRLPANPELAQTVSHIRSVDKLCNIPTCPVDDPPSPDVLFLASAVRSREAIKQFISLVASRWAPDNIFRFDSTLDSVQRIATSLKNASSNSIFAKFILRLS
ncbi:Uu.00g130020.m01.CDS01 [Anthostomella pinea]|uniref:Uu.00g130020.m01.CDS01 n=1 Tax=Anthostomella pinea TaxID=933095 RepID=A0AAI8YFQ5_9PEZI|nr:Uu.00g130020.m01.CDS01 [Anthostomella pinea]